MQAAITAPRAFDAYVDDLEAYYSGERPGRAAGGEPHGEPAVRWQGDHDLAVSLAIINREVGDRLPGPVERIERDGSRPSGRAPLPHAADVEIRHQWPPDLRPAASGRLAAIVPWEFGAVPREWAEQIDRNVDELWVPSEYVRRMYLDAGIAPGARGRDPQRRRSRDLHPRRAAARAARAPTARCDSCSSAA